MCSFRHRTGVIETIICVISVTYTHVPQCIDDMRARHFRGFMLNTVDASATQRRILFARVWYVVVRVVYNEYIMLLGCRTFERRAHSQLTASQTMRFVCGRYNFAAAAIQYQFEMCFFRCRYTSELLYTAFAASEHATQCCRVCRQTQRATRARRAIA